MQLCSSPVYHTHTVGSIEKHVDWSHTIVDLVTNDATYPGELEQKLRSNGFHSVTTHKLSGTIERWLTRRSLRAYQKRGSTSRLPLGLLRMANTLLFLLLILTDAFISWKGTTRILVVAS